MFIVSGLMFIGTGSCLHWQPVSSIEYLLNDAGNKNKGINSSNVLERSS